MKKTSVWLICQNAGSRYHGMVYRPFYLAKELVKLGYDVTIWASSNSHMLDKKPDLGDESSKIEMIDGIRYLWLRTIKYGESQSLGRVFAFFDFFFRLLAYPHKRLSPPSTIIVSSPTLFPIMAAYFWARQYKARFILDIRDIWPLTLQQLGNISKLNPVIILMRLAEKFGYRNADYVVSVWKKSASYFIENGMIPEKFRYIPNGLSLEEANLGEPLPAEICAKIPNGKTIVGYLGAIGEANENITIIQAAILLKNHPSIHFVFFGKGPKKKELEKLVSDEGLTNVSFFDPVLKSQVYEIMRRFDICTFATKKAELYKFGCSFNKVFDYMYSGKPIVAAIDSNASPIVESGCGICVEPEVPNALANAILAVATMNKEQRDSMGAKGVEFVVENHSYEALAKQYTKLIK
jgi:glycosyltransferase involved in cell wall biosynthesis